MTQSKEEILDPAFKKYRDGDADHIPISAFYEAMDTYAAQQAEGFGRWICGYYSSGDEPDQWTDPQGDTYTTAELYQLYLTQK